MSASSVTSDPVITEIVRNGVVAITEEMKSNLMRTAYNMIIYEALDFTVGLFTPKGETISIGLGLPMFIRGMAETIKAEIDHFGPGGIKPGDILLTNDAYLTGSHLNHLTFTQPIFVDDELVGFCLLHGALAGYRRNARRHDDGYLFRGSSAADIEISARRRGERGDRRNNQDERPPARPGNGRPAGTDYRDYDRRAAIPGACRKVRKRPGGSVNRRHHGPVGTRRKGAHTVDP